MFPISQLRAGMTGYGETVFSGDKISRFQVKILGVLPNMKPRQNVILAQLSGGPLAETGVIEGMSGSPVYIDGKLVGAVALGFPYAKTAIAGITPIGEMIAQEHQAERESSQPPDAGALAPQLFEATAGAAGASVPLPASTVAANLPVNGSAGFGVDGLPVLHTPLVLSGFSNAAVQHFMPQFERLGLLPVMGGSAAPASVIGGGSASSEQRIPVAVAEKTLRPGQMISVQLIRGDLGVSADGTVTYVHGKHVYAFGHRFLMSGPTALPFSRSHVLAVIPELTNSFKLSRPGRQLGVIRADDSQGVYGTFGGEAPMIPVHVHMHTPGGAEDYNFQMVDHRFLSPFLLNLALYSTLDIDARALGPESIHVSGDLNLNGAPPLRIDEMYSGLIDGPAHASSAVALPFSALYSSGIPNVHVSSINLDVDASNQLRVVQLEQAWSDRREVRPGELFHITAILRSSGGGEVTRRIPVRLPLTTPAGQVQVVLGAGQILDAMEMPQIQQGLTATELPQLVHALNNLRHDNRLYLRVLHPDTTYVLGGQQLPSPPPSLARVLTAVPSMETNVTAVHTATLFDYQSRPLPFVVSGSKELVINVKDSND